MEIAATPELVAFWNTLMGAIAMATYVSGALLVVIFLTMALTEYRHHRKQRSVVSASKPRFGHLSPTRIEQETAARTGAVDARSDG